MTTGRVFRRTPTPDPPVAVEASGSTIRDSSGREYLDAADIEYMNARIAERLSPFYSDYIRRP